MDGAASSTRQKALALNLDATFAVTMSLTFRFTPPMSWP